MSNNPRNTTAKSHGSNGKDHNSFSVLTDQAKTIEERFDKLTSFVEELDPQASQSIADALQKIKAPQGNYDQAALSELMKAQEKQITDSLANNVEITAAMNAKFMSERDQLTGNNPLYGDRHNSKLQDYQEEVLTTAAELLAGYKTAGTIDLSGTSGIQDAQTVGTPGQMPDASIQQGQTSVGL